MPCCDNDDYDVSKTTIFQKNRCFLGSRNVFLETRKKFIVFDLDHMHTWLENLDSEEIGKELGKGLKSIVDRKSD